MRDIGNKGEKLAEKYLRKKGYRIIKRNYRASTGEIDLVARDGGTVVFVEVKARTDDRFGSGLEAINSRKKQKLRSTALHYLATSGDAETLARFDIVSISMGEGEPEIEHIADAFEVQA